MKAPPIITCPTWGARQPTSEPQLTGHAPDKIIVHATAGHGPPLTPERGAVGQAEDYARMLQNDMMDRRGWNDSGHNFLVMRSGVIIQGRWNTVSAIEKGKMVWSAHCPGENDQPGIEHENLGEEGLTAAQAEASCHLMAWICLLTKIRPTRLFPHSMFYPTACPANIGPLVPHLRLRVAQIITASRGL